MSGVHEFRWPVRVYYEDTDSGGVVYHANYVKFMERGRTEWVRSLGIDQSELRRDLGVLFVVRALALQYRRPASIDDALEVVTEVEKMGHSLIKFKQKIVRGDELLVQATVEVVCVEAEKFRPAQLPAVLRNLIKPTELE